MKIITWNVNGIRAWVKKGSFDWVLSQDADIICFQETKAHPDQLTNDLRNPAGYHSYFDHSKLKKGYSGVAIYAKQKPIAVQDSFPLAADQLDQEGRFFQIEYPQFILINCYFPNGGGAPDRLAYKLEFYDAFIKHLKKLLKAGKEVVVCGDFNIVHNEPDSARFKENQGNIGFLPEERDKLDQFLKIGLVDAFRQMHPDIRDVYTWWDMKSFARERNIGWRIDTFFISKGLVDNLKDIEVHDLVFGSDHCPVSLMLEFKDKK